MVNAIVSDSKLWCEGQFVVEVVKEFFKKHSITIDLLNEGPDLEFCGIYALLDSITTAFNIPKSAITIITHNIEESHSEYNILIKGSAWIPRAQSQINNYIDTNKNAELKHIGLFVARTNWPRLGFLSWLNDTFLDKTLMTCHYDGSNEIHRSTVALQEVNHNIPEELPSVVNFLKKCPVIINNEHLSIPPDPKVLYSLNQTVYKNIFIELVCETFFTGSAFCPNEKTLRPIMAKTPFVIMGPQSYLETLRRCGFKTFGQYWDESYDNFSGVDRYNKIKTVLTHILSLDQKTLTMMYTDMKPLLEHNRQRLLEMNKDSFKKIQNEQ